MRAFAVSAFFLVATACSSSPSTPSDSGTTTDSGTATDSGTGRVPRVHRTSATECSHDRGPGDADPETPSADCTADLDCTSGDNGRCLLTRGGARTNYCSYDACFTDTDCGASQVCGCRGQPVDANACVGGDCVVDADCGAGGYCSPSRAFDQINYGVAAYYCHTADDECIDDEDCPTDTGDVRCTFFPDRGHWACSTTGFFPP